MNSLNHYTLSTGHARQSPRSEVADDIIEMLTPMTEPGEHDMPNDASLSLVVPIVERGFWATVQSGKTPLATITVAADEDDADYLWPHIEKQYHQLTDMPGLRSADFVASKRPAKTPWCVAWPILATPAQGMWLGDFERCLAWAWLERKGEVESS